MRIFKRLSCAIIASVLFFSVFLSIWSGAGEEEPIEPLQAFTHTVFVEEMTATWCGHCPYVAEALNNIYDSNDYPFYFVAMITDYNDNASQRADDYNIPGYPSTIFDGGYETKVGSTNDDTQQTEDDIRPLIESCGEREAHGLEVEVKAYDLGDSALQISVNITNLEGEEYGGHLRTYITEIISRYPMADDNPYHFGFLDYAFDLDITVPADSFWEDEVIWVGSENHDNPENPDDTQYFGDIVPSNIMIIAAVFNDEVHVGNYDPPYTAFVFEAYYVDQTAATIPSPPPNYSVEISPTTQSHTVSPGQLTVFNLNIKNTGDAEDGFSITKSGDQSDWATLSDTWISLEPNSSQDITLEVNVPSDAIEGDYDIFVTATSDGNPSATTTATTTSIVSTVVTHGVNLFSGQSSLTTHPGESVIYTITVENTGNTEDTIDISKSGANSHWGTLSHDSLNIQPGSSQDITLTVDVPSDAQTGDHTIFVKGTSQGNPSLSDEISLITTVEPYIYDVDLEPEYQDGSVEKGDSIKFTINVKNTGNVQQIINLTIYGSVFYWASLSDYNLDLEMDEEQNVILTIDVPSNADLGEQSFEIIGYCEADPSIHDDVDVSITVTEPNIITITDMNHSPSNPTTNDEVIITATVTGDNIQSVYLNYYRGTTPFTHLQMQSIGNDQYSINIGSLDAGEYEYEVNAEDNDGNTYTSQKSSFTVIEPQITISDVMHSPSDPTKDDEITVTATILGDNIESVNLDYCKDGICYPSIQMQPSSSNQYSVTFGPLEVGDYEYEIRAEDDIGNSYKSSKFSLTVENASTPKNGDGTTDGKGEAPWYESENARYIILLLIIVIIVCALLAGVFARRPKKAATEEVDSQIIQLIPEEPIPEAQTVTTPMAVPAAAPVATEPVFSPITLPENEDISCPKCYTVFSIPFKPRPMPVQCPSCGQKGIID